MALSSLGWFVISCMYLIANAKEHLFMRNSTNNSRQGMLAKRILSEESAYCDPSAANNALYKRYFDGMKSVYKGPMEDGTCLNVHRECGWPKAQNVKSKNLPLFVFSVGLEGAGHHLWTEIFSQPVFDCVWTNGRHYFRDIADGVPRTTAKQLGDGIKEQFRLRLEAGKRPCKSIYDAEDSFPTGAIRQNGRVFMRPDIINLQQLDGVLFNVKYLIILRNTTDTAISALRRNFFNTIDQELRTVEHTLTYLEAALRGVPCHKTFIAHYEQALAEPRAFIEPLAQFLELNPESKSALSKRLSKKGKMPKRKAHKLTQYKECKDSKLNSDDCYAKITKLFDEFFQDRSFMWPTFAGNGFDFAKLPLMAAP